MIKVVLITGSSRGIGKELALSFAREGYQVALNYKKSKTEAEDLVSEIKRLGADTESFKADVSKQSEAVALVDEVIKKFKRIDVLINNAGVTRDRTIMKMSFEEWDEVIKTNLYGTFFTAKECAKYMAKQKDGSIINIASISSFEGSFGASNYAASKAAVLAFTKSAAREFGRFNIRVNAVLPGFHLTDMGNNAPEHIKEKVKVNNVLGVTTDIKDLSKLVLTIADLKTVSGQIFNCDARII